MDNYLSPESLKWLYGSQGDLPKLDVSGTFQFKDNLKDVLASLGYVQDPIIFQIKDAIRGVYACLGHAPTPLDEIANRFLVNITRAYYASALRQKRT